MLKNALHEFFTRLPLMMRGLKLVWRAAGKWTVIWAMLLLLQGLVPACVVYLSRTAVNQLSAAMDVKDMAGAFISAWPPLLLIGFLWIFGQLLSSLAAWVRKVQNELVQDHIQELIHNHAIRLDMSFFDHPDSYDLLYRASVEAVYRPLILLENVGSFIQSSITLLILSSFLAAYSFWLPFLLIFSVLPGLWAIGNFIFREHQWHINNTVNHRIIRYFDCLLTEHESAAEVRLFELGAHFKRRYAHTRDLVRAGQLKLAKDELKTEFTAALITWTGGIIGMAWMLLQAARGIVRLGDLVLCYQSFQQGQGLLRSLLDSAGQIYRSTLFLENLFQFLAIQPVIADISNPITIPSPLRQGIRFENISFSYPGCEGTALSGFSLDLGAGRITAVVGRNGSGKSTLIKLLCRFYDPSHGQILIDGRDLREFATSDLRKRIAVLFQEPIHYYTTASENIALGSIDRKEEVTRIRRAALDADAEMIIRRLSQGYDTVLGKWFGGVELSVGEWQRLALARAFFRDGLIIVLDEPTSAMDSWAEAQWLGRFRDLARGRTTLIITHRFTTAMHADIIHVMSEGKIIESGTHDQLISAGGSYAESWRMQMSETQNA